MKLLIVAGGGGHFVAALAVIQQLPKDWDIVMVGRKHAFEGDTALSLEYQTCKKLNISFETLTTGRLQRKFSTKTLSSILKIPSGLVEARQIISKHKPDIVISFGGYVSVPIIAASAWNRLPIVIHEQTQHAGLANKFAARFATKICISWADSQKFFPQEKTVLTGNPLRREFLAAQTQKPQHPARVVLKKVLQNLPKGGLISSSKNVQTIYITGGSAGAHGINVLIEGCLTRLLQHYKVVHQTGDAQEFHDYDRLKQLRETLPDELQKRYEVHKFIDPEKVGKFLQEADLVISRSGINTVTEILYLGKPALFIPLPYGQYNEQQTNAAFVRNLGLAEVADQNAMDSIFLLTRIQTMMNNLNIYKKNAEKAKAMVRIDAADQIINVIKEVYAEKKNKN